MVHSQVGADGFARRFRPRPTDWVRLVEPVRGLGSLGALEIGFVPSGLAGLGSLGAVEIGFVPSPGIPRSNSEPCLDLWPMGSLGAWRFDLAIGFVSSWGPD